MLKLRLKKVVIIITVFKVSVFTITVYCCLYNIVVLAHIEYYFLDLPNA